MAGSEIPAKTLYPNHLTLKTQYGTLIRSLVRKRFPRAWRSPWIDREDFEAQAWETAHRVYCRLGHLPEPDFGNVLVRSVLNDLVNQSARLHRWKTYSVPLLDIWVIPRDPIESLIIRVALETLAGHLPPHLSQVLEGLTDPQMNRLKGGGVTVTRLASRIGRSRRTTAGYLKELRTRLAVDLDG